MSGTWTSSCADASTTRCAPSTCKWLRGLPHVPRPALTQLLALPVPAGGRVYSRGELAAMDGEDGRDLCVAINGKVLRYVGKQVGEGAGSSAFCAYECIKADYGGRDVTHLLSLMCYEPRFPIAACAEEMAEEQKQAVEDLYCRKLTCFASFAFQVIGMLDPDTPSPVRDGGSPQVDGRALTEGECTDGVKARRRKGSLTSSILCNLRQIVDEVESSVDREASGEEWEGEEEVGDVGILRGDRKGGSGSSPPLSYSVSCVSTVGGDESPSVESRGESPLSGMRRSVSELGGR